MELDYMYYVDGYSPKVIRANQGKNTLNTTLQAIQLSES